MESTSFDPINPIERRVERGVMSRQQPLPIDWQFFVWDDAAALEAGTGRGHEVAGRMDQEVAVRQFVEECGECLAHRCLTEDASAAERLHASRETLRGAASHRIDQDRERALVRLDTLTSTVDQPRV